MTQSRLAFAFAFASHLRFPHRSCPPLTQWVASRSSAAGGRIAHPEDADGVSIEGPIALDSAICVGLDGSPWPRDSEETAEQKRRSEETETDKEYYSHRKASPLSEIEIADTRKPITQATDGTAAPREYGGGRSVIGWLPEQLDTAEDSLKRATLIFKRNAERGDPESFPHSRVLREMRGEWF